VSDGQASRDVFLSPPGLSYFFFDYPRPAPWAEFLRRSAAVLFVMVLCVGSRMLYIGFIRRNRRDFRNHHTEGLSS
jgi:hypothetical protein